ncbi:tRNA nucleotidyl transferase [Capsaspora owczarzaki ATCC 30864]|uniref:tRNA nucleotidyl transferase n=1 Tax=Capsaspora owczarzaki (strain ATCC 30864) TaxID=595528 RepID=A0A0D2WS67_CAPO3|nr:tRNA nucleotidyl transferase [Capsaspora owczarzaki ATCC 30864]KJE94223.1 tRNA nucleotidyl transferase [Capsaspora owczarzaki ATCC 30864]|eukprot:XP_004347651.2 tRNA nucleotidyl transferase [Capsaspora owczarzaki ATCC 30864]
MLVLLRHRLALSPLSRPRTAALASIAPIRTSALAAVTTATATATASRPLTRASSSCLAPSPPSLPTSRRFASHSASCSAFTAQNAAARLRNSSLSLLSLTASASASASASVHPARLLHSKPALLQMDLLPVAAELAGTPGAIGTLNCPLWHQVIGSSSLQEIHRVVTSHGYSIRIVGGAVRDLLMNIQPKDVDLATEALPDVLQHMFEEAGIRVIPTGLKHGTVTVVFERPPSAAEQQQVVDNGTDPVAAAAATTAAAGNPRKLYDQYEVTTLRVDKITDGRHAEVEFTSDWSLDAQRRDLRFNSMSIDFNGTVYDYFGGVQDLQNNHIAFVGTADLRIKEDYLRILRFFRFYGRMCDSLGQGNVSVEPGTLECIAENAPNLSGISAERIWLECSKILQQRSCPHTLEVMTRCGVANIIGLADLHQSVASSEIRLLQQLEMAVRHTTELALQLPPTDVADRWKEHAYIEMIRLSNIVKNEDSAAELALRWKLSNQQRDLLLFLVFNRHLVNEPDSAFARRLALDMLVDKVHPDWVAALVFPYVSPQEIYFANIPVFPLSGDVLAKSGVPKGKTMGLVLASTRQLWKNAGFQVSENELVQHALQVSGNPTLALQPDPSMQTVVNFGNLLRAKQKGSKQSGGH